MELVDEPERAIAQAAALDVARAAHRLARDADLARGRLVEPAEQLQQRGLARARRADDREPIALRDRELHAPQHLDLAAHVREDLREPQRLEHGPSARSFVCSSHHI